MKHDGSKRGQGQPGAKHREVGVGQARRADASMVGRRYETGAALRGLHGDEHGAQLGADGAAVVSAVDQQAVDLRAQHGATIRAGSGAAGVPEHAVAAVVLAESDLIGATDGRPALRFEPYAFYQRTGRWVVATHKDQGAEYSAFERAASVDAAAAQASVRVGLGQIAGSEAEAAGFADAAAMMHGMAGSEAAQLDGLMCLIGNHDALSTALTSEDWTQVAELRAGPGYGAISYDQALATYADAYQRCGPESASGVVAGAVAHGDDDDDNNDKDDGKPKNKRKKTP